MATRSTDDQLVKIALIALGSVLVLPIFFMGFGPMMDECGAVVCGVTG